MNADKERQYMQLKQLKALSNKSYNLLEKSRRVEMENARMGEAFQRSRHLQENRLQNSQSIVLDKSGDLEQLGEEFSARKSKRDRRKEPIIHKIHPQESAINPENL